MLSMELASNWVAGRFNQLTNKDLHQALKVRLPGSPLLHGHSTGADGDSPRFQRKVKKDKKDMKTLLGSYNELKTTFCSDMEAENSG